MDVKFVEKISVFESTCPKPLKKALQRWLFIIQQITCSNFDELKKSFNSVDIFKNSKGENLTIFNIHGNDIRLIATVFYGKQQSLYIRDILTHKEYDKEKWKS